MRKNTLGGKKATKQVSANGSCVSANRKVMGDALLLREKCDLAVEKRELTFLSLMIITPPVNSRQRGSPHTGPVLS